jgi:hypothetical protein
MSSAVSSFASPSRSLLRLRTLLRAATALSLAATGCGLTEAPRIDRKDFPLDACTAGTYAPLEGVTPAEPVDYLELRQAHYTSASYRPPGYAVGEPCKTAHDKDACTVALASLRSERGFRPGVWENPEEYVVFTRGDEVGKITDVEALRAFLAPIDNLKDAAFLVTSQPNGYRVTCGAGNARIVPHAFELIVDSGSTCGSGGLDESLVAVDAAGTVSVMRKARVEDGDPGCIAGRRPEGFVAVAATGQSSVGALFAEIAELEAASVYAFARLAEELDVHDAPRALVEEALASIDDEVRHAKMTAAIARRYGVDVAPTVVDARGVRDLLSIAIENATEGCVRETFGAAVATYQAARAEDPAIAGAMRLIAEDETRHAALAWDVAAWLDAMLSEEQRTKVAAARAQAVHDLAAALDVEPIEEATRLAGMPDARAARALFDAVAADLWRALPS